MTSKAQPFLKWAGGKRWLASSESLPVPKSFRRYIEPFVGGGALFFHIEPSNAILSDLNAELVNCYVQIRDNLASLQEALRGHDSRHSVDHYYETRSLNPSCDLEAAARFLYLNRTCWNGLYRVNRRGEFNVPIGTKTKVLYDDGELESASKALKRADILCQDFGVAMAEAREGDLVFLDPPYTANHNMNGFLKYNESIFSWVDQIRLRDAVASAADRGAYVMVTNADHESVRDLYRDCATYGRVHRRSVLAGKASMRRATTEALFTVNIDRF